MPMQDHVDPGQVTVRDSYLPSVVIGLLPNTTLFTLIATLSEYQLSSHSHHRTASGGRLKRYLVPLFICSIAFCRRSTSQLLELLGAGQFVNLVAALVPGC